MVKRCVCIFINTVRGKCFVLIDDIKKDAEHLFDDVVEEYCTISLILQHFGEWRNRLVTSYAQAYIPMCLPQLLAPLIRVQMLSWNPLEVSLHPIVIYGSS